MRPFTFPWTEAGQPVFRQRDGQRSKALDQSNLYFRAFARYFKGVNRTPANKTNWPAIAISILAGGRSSRMGRDKARLRFSRKSLLGHIRSIAKKTGWPVRVVRRDAVARCGPLGGIYTALKTSRAEAHLFLACDMPFVSPALLTALAARLSPKRNAVFASLDGTAGFPCCIQAAALPMVERQIQERRLSLQALAKALRAKLLRVPKHRAVELFNVNTPADWLAARRLHAVPDRPTLGGSRFARQ